MSMTTMATAAAAAIYLFTNASADTGWYASLTGGTDIPTGGAGQKAMSSTLTDLGGLNPALTGGSGTFTFNRTSWNDIYGASPMVNFQFGYDWSSAFTTYGSVSYIWDDSKTFLAGNANIPALGGAQNIYGTFSDYSDWLVTAGMRYTFDSGSPLKPFIGADLGAAFLKSVDATYTIPAAAITVANAKLYDGTTVFTGGIEAGLAYDITPTVALTGSVGLRYVDGMDGGRSDLSALGIASTPDAAQRLTVPLTIGLSTKF